jgi:hypothetical protein
MSGVTKESLIARTKEILVEFGNSLNGEMQLSGDDFVVKVGPREDFLDPTLPPENQLNKSVEMNFPKDADFILSVKLGNKESENAHAARATLMYFFASGRTMQEKLSHPVGLAADSLEELAEKLERCPARAQRRLEAMSEKWTSR